jgi:hypothetical protein
MTAESAPAVIARVCKQQPDAFDRTGNIARKSYSRSYTKNMKLHEEYSFNELVSLDLDMVYELKNSVISQIGNWDDVLLNEIM